MKDPGTRAEQGGLAMGTDRVARFFALAMMVTLPVIGCRSSPIIRDAREDHGSPVPGTTPALAEYLKGASGPVTIVLVHGVGFHCPLFGLDKSSGWLSDTRARALGLEPQGDPGPPQLIWDLDNRANGEVDRRSAFYLTRRSFVYHDQDHHLTVPVLAAEITWSGLTAWVKDKQLAFDLTNNVAPGIMPRDHDVSSLQHDPNPVEIACPGIPDASYPYRRLMVNRLVKEGTLDMSLSDAVLYMGSYGPKIERAVAEVMCRLTSTKTYESTERCEWPALDALERRQFVFMTHSLGSRIVYDTLLELMRVSLRPHTAPVFDPNYLDQAEPIAEEIIGHTAAVYMFANQLPLVGLANEDVTARSDEAPKPLIAFEAYVAALALARDRAARTAVTAQSSHCPDPLICFARERSRLVKSRDAHAGTLEIVAFSDPNDLLSYPIPSWYVRDDLQFDMHITNVSVQNATHWLIFEWPQDAHDGYFTQADVWGVIRCGANAGRIGECAGR